MMVCARSPGGSRFSRCARLCALGAVVALAGCATSEPEPKSIFADHVAPEGPLDTDRTIERQVDNRAVAMLWDRAEKARRNGNLELAVSSIERALRLAPNDPILWSRLAELRLRQKDFAVAENLAAKSNALAGNYRLLRYRNWLIIAAAREHRGDTKGAQLARRRAERIRMGTAGL